jgi:hypothetical protein
VQEAYNLYWCIDLSSYPRHYPLGMRPNYARRERPFYNRKWSNGRSQRYPIVNNSKTVQIGLVSKNSEYVLLCDEVPHCIGWFGIGAHDSKAFHRITAIDVLLNRFEWQARRNSNKVLNANSQGWRVPTNYKPSDNMGILFSDHTLFKGNSPNGISHEPRHPARKHGAGRMSRSPWPS